jgi:hypothetical protein
MDNDKGKKLKEIDLNDLKFTANGKEYFVEPQVSAERFAMMQELEIELGFGIKYKTLFDGLGEAYKLLNDGRNADAAVHIHQLQEGIAGLETRDYVIMQYCACFINTMDEDRRVYDEKIMLEKIEDWNKEGITYQSFFPLAINMVNGLKENYLLYTEDTLKTTTKEESEKM